MAQGLCSSVVSFIIVLLAGLGAFPAAAQQLKIMPMGDSITAGNGTLGGYRLPLYNLLQAGAYSFDFVGSKTQTGDTCPDTNHWGQSGWQISDTTQPINGINYVSIQGQNRQGLYDEMASAISTAYFSTNTSSRNIILLLIGINDVLHQVVDSSHGTYNSDAGSDGQGEGQDWIAEGNIVRLQSLLHYIDDRAAFQNLQLEIILSTSCPLTKAWTGDAVSDVLSNEVAQYNGYITSAIPANVFSNISVKLVDQYAATVGKLADGLHPSSTGYQAMAQVWYSAITNTSASPNPVQASILNSPQWLSNGQFQFMLSGVAGQSYVIEASTNLSQWMPLITNVLTNGVTIYSDSQTTNFINRLYRAKESP